MGFEEKLKSMWERNVEERIREQVGSLAVIGGGVRCMLARCDEEEERKEAAGKTQTSTPTLTCLELQDKTLLYSFGENKGLW